MVVIDLLDRDGSCKGHILFRYTMLLLISFVMVDMVVMGLCQGESLIMESSRGIARGEPL